MYDHSCKLDGSRCSFGSKIKMKVHFVFRSLNRISDLRSKILTLENAQIKFGISLTKSYLCTR